MKIESQIKHFVHCKNVKEACRLSRALIRKCRNYNGFGEVQSANNESKTFRKNGKDIIKILCPDNSNIVRVYLYEDGNYDICISDIEQDLLDIVWVLKKGTDIYVQSICFRCSRRKKIFVKYDTYCTIMCS